MFSNSASDMCSLPRARALFGQKTHLALQGLAQSGPRRSG